MATWATFRAELSDFAPVALVLTNAIESGKFGEQNDGTNTDIPVLVDVRDIYLQNARDEIRLDIQSMLSLRIGDATADAAVDAMVTTGSGADCVMNMRRLLAVKQISLAFLTLSKKPEDKYADDLKFWTQRYEAIRAEDVPALLDPPGVQRARAMRVG